MAKRKTPEETIVDYFRDASLEKAEAILNIVKGTVKSRQAAKPTRKSKVVSTANATDSAA